jgi:hypothetical protein
LTIKNFFGGQKMLKRLSIIPITLGGELIHEDLDVHVIRSEYFRLTLESFCVGRNNTMAWVTLEYEDGTKINLLKKYNGKLFDSEGMGVKLDDLKL